MWKSVAGAGAGGLECEFGDFKHDISRYSRMEALCGHLDMELWNSAGSRLKTSKGWGWRVD